MSLKSKWYQNKYLSLPISFLASGLFVAFIDLLIHQAVFKPNEIQFLGLIGPFGIGSISGCLIVYFVLKIKAKSERLPEWLFSAMEEASIGVIVWDVDERLVMFNSYYGEIQSRIKDYMVPGITYEEYIRQVGIQLAGDVDAEGGLENWIKLRLEEHRSDFQEREVLRDGRWYLIKKQRLKDGGIIGIHTEISELKLADDRLRLSEERFKDFTQAAADRFWETDKNHLMTFLSPPSGDLSGPINKAIGKTQWDVEHRKVSAETKAEMKALFDSHKPFHNRHFSWLNSKGKLRHVLISDHLCGAYQRNRARRYGLLDEMETPDQEQVQLMKAANRKISQWMDKL